MFKASFIQRTGPKLFLTNGFNFVKLYFASDVQKAGDQNYTRKV